MSDLQKVAELTKALQDGKTLVSSDGTTYFLVNGFICRKYETGSFRIGADIYYLDDFKIQEPEPPFEITENQLAEYECRDGSKAVCYGAHNDTYRDYPYPVLYSDGDYNSANINGRTNTPMEMPTDLIRKIRDL